MEQLGKEERAVLLDQIDVSRTRPPGCLREKDVN
jgi:hypothetical protein